MPACLGPRGIFYQLLDSDLGLEIKIMDLFKSLLSQERSLGVSELRFQSGTTFVQWNFFFCVLSLRFFFSCWFI
ncbi:hypothetical protein Nmel_016009 [Mimus melanotis]